MLEWIAENKDLAEAMSYWATVAGFFVAIVGGLTLIWSHLSSLRQTNWIRAHELYGQYLRDSLSVPEYFQNYLSRSDISSDERWKYHCFVSQLLWALEGILRSSNTDEWRVSVANDLQYHSDFLASDQFQDEADTYLPELRELILAVRSGVPGKVTNA